jgi:hypothetical protein
MSLTGFPTIKKSTERNDMLMTKVQSAMTAVQDLQDYVQESGPEVLVRLYGIARKDNNSLISFRNRELCITRDENVARRQDSGFQKKLSRLGLEDKDVRYVVATFRKDGTWKNQR